MSGTEIGVKILGLQNCYDVLLAIPLKLQKQALGKALRKAIKPVQAAAVHAAPVLSLRNYLKAPFRKPGVLREAIKIRNSKTARTRGAVGVFVNVKPLPGAKYKTVRRSGGLLRGPSKQRVLVKASQRSARNPLDPFYWRFIEFGWKHHPQGYEFLQRSAARLPEAVPIFEKELAPFIERLAHNGNDPL
jgi:hypothetical protein